MDRTDLTDSAERFETTEKVKYQVKKPVLWYNHYEYSQMAKTEEFKEKYKKRASHEWKNGEMKRFHGLDRARGYGLKSVSMQAKLTGRSI